MPLMGQFWGLLEEKTGPDWCSWPPDVQCPLFMGWGEGGREWGKKRHGLPDYYKVFQPPCYGTFGICLEHVEDPPGLRVLPEPSTPIIHFRSKLVHWNEGVYCATIDRALKMRFNEWSSSFLRPTIPEL